LCTPGPMRLVASVSGDVVQVVGRGEVEVRELSLELVDEALAWAQSSQSGVDERVDEVVSERVGWRVGGCANAPLVVAGSAMSQRATPNAYLGTQEQSFGGSGGEAEKDIGAAFAGGAHALGFLQQRRVPVPDGPVYSGATICS